MLEEANCWKPRWEWVCGHTTQPRKVFLMSSKCWVGGLYDLDHLLSGLVPPMSPGVSFLYALLWAQQPSEPPYLLLPITAALLEMKGKAICCLKLKGLGMGQGMECSDSETKMISI